MHHVINNNNNTHNNLCLYHKSSSRAFQITKIEVDSAVWFIGGLSLWFNKNMYIIPFFIYILAKYFFYFKNVCHNFKKCYQSKKMFVVNINDLLECHTSCFIPEIHSQHASLLKADDYLICCHKTIHWNLSPFFCSFASHSTSKRATGTTFARLTQFFFRKSQQHHFRRHSTFLLFHSMKWNRHDGQGQHNGPLWWFLWRLTP